MRIETPKDAKVVRAKMPYKKLLSQLEKPKAALKRATIEDMPPLTEATRQATVERERKDGKLRGVQSGESYEQALERFAREDGKPYTRSFESEEEEKRQAIEEQEVIDQLYFDHPELRPMIIKDQESQGRDPSSIEKPTEKIQMPDLDLEGDVSDDALLKEVEDIYKHEKPKTFSEPFVQKGETVVIGGDAPTKAAPSKASAFFKGFKERQEKNSEDAPAPQQTAAETTNLMRSMAGASVAPQEAGGMNALQEQAKRYLMKR